MRLLNFELPSFVRINYVSKEAEEYWSPKVRLAAQASRELELLTVQEGLREATTGYMDPNDMARQQRELLARGLVFVPVRKSKHYQGLAHRHVQPKPGDRWNYYGVIVREASTAYKWVKHEELTSNVEHDQLADLLGYPECCRRGFHKNWVEGKYIDPIWQIAQATGESYLTQAQDRLLHFNEQLPWETNVMLRYIGVRLVPHLPCRFDCEESVKLARTWLELGRKHNVPGLIELEQLLQMNISWDVLKGIAIISTPIMKITANSVTCYPNYVVEKEGTYYPEKAASRGTKFPFKVPPKLNKILELRKLQAEGKLPIYKDVRGDSVVQG